MVLIGAIMDFFHSIEGRGVNKRYVLDQPPLLLLNSCFAVAVFLTSAYVPAAASPAAIETSDIPI